MAKKHVNAGKQGNRSKGSATKSLARGNAGRERNVGHRGSEEHSRTAKGNSGQYGRR